MGVVLDSSVPIKAQRMRMNESAMLRAIRVVTGNVELVTSTIVVTELCQGIWPASTPETLLRRQQFVEEFLVDIPVFPYGVEMALLAGKVGGEQMARGFTIPMIDLMIGATALHLNYSILTTNFRHFRQIPNLHVIPF